MKEVFGTWAEFRKLVSDLGCHCLFRGHSSADFDIIPSVGRPHSKYQPDSRVEEDLLAQFKIRALPFLRSKPSNDLEWLVIGRHYGLRTRLLDWSQNPFVALYFALECSSIADVVPPAIVIAKSPQMVAFEEICANHRKQEGLVFFEPPHLDMRIANQESHLALHPDPFQPLRDEKFIQFNLYPFETKELLAMLYDIGIKHSTIYPDLTGVCRHLNDNPSFVAPTLEIARSWNSVPKAFIGMTVNEIEDALIRDRSLWHLIQLINPLQLIGIPLQTEDGMTARLRGVYPQRQQVSIWTEGDSNITIDNEMEALQGYKVEQSAISRLFPNGGIRFRTRRPIPS